MTLWNPNNQAHRTTGREDELPFPSGPITEIYDPHPEFSIEVDRPPPTLEEMRMIIYCHWLIELMPRETLRELLETIAEIYLDYQISYQEPPALPPPDREKKAAYGGRVKSPPFVIEFDEV